MLVGAIVALLGLLIAALLYLMHWDYNRPESVEARARARRIRREHERVVGGRG